MKQRIYCRYKIKWVERHWTTFMFVSWEFWILAMSLYYYLLFIFPLLSEIDVVIEKIDFRRPIYSFVNIFYIVNVSFKCESIKRIFLNNDIYSAHKLFSCIHACECIYFQSLLKFESIINLLSYSILFSLWFLRK